MKPGNDLAVAGLRQLDCRNVSADSFLASTGIGGASRPLPEREQERPRLSERLSPAPPQVRCLWCRRAGAACSFARAASTL